MESQGTDPRGTPQGESKAPEASQPRGLSPPRQLPPAQVTPTARSSGGGGVSSAQWLKSPALRIFRHNSLDVGSPLRTKSRSSYLKDNAQFPTPRDLVACPPHPTCPMLAHTHTPLCATRLHSLWVTEGPAELPALGQTEPGQLGCWKR